MKKRDTTDEMQFTVKFVVVCDEEQYVKEVETQVFDERELMWRLTETPEYDCPKVYRMLWNLLEKGKDVFDYTPYALRRLLQLAEPSDGLVDKVKGKLLRLALRLLLPRDVAARLENVESARMKRQPKMVEE